MLAVKIGQSKSGEGQPELGSKTREVGHQTVQNQAVNTALISAGKQVLTQGITQFADFTGNYAVSETFSEIMSVGSDLAILSTGAFGVLAVGVKTSITISNSFIKQQRAREDIALQRQLAGYVSKQGSRYK